MPPDACSNGRAVPLRPQRPKGRPIRFVREMPVGSRFHDVRLSTDRVAPEAIASSVPAGSLSIGGMAISTTTLLIGGALLLLVMKGKR